MDQKLKAITTYIPGVQLKADTKFSWSAPKNTITYDKDAISTSEGLWSLLHEVGHAMLKHDSYKTDLELVKIEVAAWEEAKRISQKIHEAIDDDYIEDCLDSYRDWLHKRSLCPTCGNTALQTDIKKYTCHNCHSIWSVSRSRLCRPYRQLTTN